MLRQNPSPQGSGALAGSWLVGGRLEVCTDLRNSARGGLSVTSRTKLFALHRRPPLLANKRVRIGKHVGGSTLALASRNGLTTCTGGAHSLDERRTHNRQRWRNRIRLWSGELNTRAARSRDAMALRLRVGRRGRGAVTN